MFFSYSLLFKDRYVLNLPKGNFKLKIKPEQLIMRFSSDILKVFPEFASIPYKFKLNFAERILHFLNQYKFVEKGNVQLTDNHKVQIASSYIKLTLGFSTYLIRSIHTIVIYPTAQFFPAFEETHKGHFNPAKKTIMLALDVFENDIFFSDDGINIAFHEFSHALCFELLARYTKHPSGDNFKRGFKNVQNWFANTENSQAIKKAQFVRDYGFTDPLELVAVLIELFFEKEIVFKQNFPELYFHVGKMINHPKVK